MSCILPLKAYRTLDGLITFNELQAHGSEFFVPCGQCTACRISRSRTWATRCVHESTFYKKNSFITLTYNDENLPNDQSLCPDDARNFIRRLRDKIGKEFKYFLCGEYGDENQRPHYHAIIFGHDFGLSNYKTAESNLSVVDKRPKLHEEFHDSEALVSDELSDLWKLGLSSVGELTFDSCAYVAQYATKKINGSQASTHYNGRTPEFMRCSKRETIGKRYALKYANEIIRDGKCMVDGNETPIPQYYLKLYEKMGYDLSSLKMKREEFSSQNSLQTSYVLASKLDSMFRSKTNRVEKLRLKYLSAEYHSKRS